MARIHCSVSNCHYWKSGNVCDASEIMITSDTIGDTMGDNFDAPKASTAPQTPVASCMETCCKTFVASDNAAKNADGVYRK